MTDELKSKVTDYAIVVRLFKKMHDDGVLSDKDYEEILTTIAEECGLNSSTIFR